MGEYSNESVVGVGAAARTDLAAVVALVEAAGLPTHGIDEQLETFVVARDAEQVVAAAALEWYADGALLRSLVVAPTVRRRGLATRLHRHLVERARLLGVRRVHLLTTDATAFFRAQGFEECDRAEVPAGVARSWQFEHGACTTATCMRSPLLAVEDRMALQDFHPGNHCFGCGPHNEGGLRLRSFRGEGGECVARFLPGPQHNAGPPAWLNGGIIATLIDCHGVFAALAGSYDRAARSFGSDPQLWSVTASLSVRYRRPAPIDREVSLLAHVREHQGRSTTVDIEMLSGNRACASGVLVAVEVADDWRRGPTATAPVDGTR